jgi:four helix bundle protein
MRIIKFEELDSWKKARELANVIFDLTGQREFKRDFTLCDQLRGASGSVMHNIAEGFDAGSDLEFIRFLKISRRSASESQSQLYLALDRKYITAIQLEAAYNKANEVKKLVNGMIAYLRQNRKKSHGNIVAESHRGIIK